MCSPKNHEQKLHGAITEIISGMSSLHMTPSPIPLEEQTPDNNGFLSDTDGYVKHSLEHFHEAVNLINEGTKEAQLGLINAQRFINSLELQPEVKLKLVVMLAKIADKLAS